MSIGPLPNPRSLVSSILAVATTGQDVVGVYNSDYDQVFPNARPMRAFIKRESATMDHPIETGSQVTDFRILLQVEIELLVILNRRNYKETYEKIAQSYIAGDLFTIETKAGTFRNQLLQAIPHEETTDMFDTFTMVLKFRETQFADTAVTDVFPQNARDGNTVDRGQLQSKAASEEQTKQSSVIFKLFGGLF